ncbi:hypothetical protein E2C01_074278 [Portunus trituberculatus]|uniref:Uncharacterized protein n=1 Tax=Portunus trituberculatus TaxID=210409 RepID=A0A5B7IGN4_PORTR|nr:hypothetical protein [Portunus trituberculatus]
MALSLSSRALEAAGYWGSGKGGCGGGSGGGGGGGGNGDGRVGVADAAQRSEAADVLLCSAAPIVTTPETSVLTGAARQYNARNFVSFQYLLMSDTLITQRRLQLFVTSHLSLHMDFSAPLES